MFEHFFASAGSSSFRDEKADIDVAPELGNGLERK